VVDVTVDANIYISALEFGGLPLRFLNHARRGVFQISISEAVLAEVRRVLHDKFLWQDARLDEAIAELGAFTTKVEPTETLTVVEANPDDDRVLECAVTAGSRYIVTGDNDLLRLGAYTNIQIIRVADFLAIIEAPKESPTEASAPPPPEPES
jgi:putative PIN family toxin of toxin-antitoxin system